MSTDQGPLILVVDDYEDAREMYAEYLRFCGFRVAEARNGSEALEQAFALMPDLILMDLSLPVMDGWEATRRIKADERTRQIPVVALTGHALAGASEGANRAGCDSFVTKPGLPDALVVEVRRMLSRLASRHNEDTWPSPARVQPPPVPRPAPRADAPGAPGKGRQGAAMPRSMQNRGRGDSPRRSNSRSAAGRSGNGRTPKRSPA